MYKTNTELQQRQQLPPPGFTVHKHVRVDVELFSLSSATIAPNHSGRTLSSLKRYIQREGCLEVLEFSAGYCITV